MPEQIIEDQITRLLTREGGFVNHPEDKGGPTNMGITLGTLSDSRGYPCTVGDVRDLDEEEARFIYFQHYWVNPGFFTLSLGPVMDELLFDTGVHSGPRRAVKLLQLALSVEPDGIIGPVTREFAHRMDRSQLAALYLGERVSYLGRVITDDSSQAVFAAGWMNRMRDLMILIPTA